MQLPFGGELLGRPAFGKPLLDMVPLTVVFAAPRYPLLTKYAVQDPAQAKEQ